MVSEQTDSSVEKPVTGSCCRVCLGTDLERVGRVGWIEGSVTSDSQRSDYPVSIWECSGCHHIQKCPDERSMKEIDRIYREYRAHYLSGGVEQQTFNGVGGTCSRSRSVFNRVMESLPVRGKLLDVGSGNGAILRTANAVLPHWELYAHDVSDHCQKEIESLPGVSKFATHLSDFANGTFDLIVLWHVLEHVPQPLELLRELAHLLTEEGRILIQVPDVEQNPFDLGVFDHLSHFTRESLRSLAEQSGLNVMLDGDDWVANCLTVSLGGGVKLHDGKGKRRSCQAHRVLESLNESLAKFQSETFGEDPYVIFGTSQAALLTYLHLENRPEYFIDEDPFRQGKDWMGIPVCSPDVITKNMKIIMPFSPLRAKGISSRLRSVYPQLEKNAFVMMNPNIEAEETSMD